ncbi:MAG: protein-methionine-sulfoxide reductase heme-binding subunit MsrQ [Candidatus Palauibacterales bacterium]|nr:protein-methionine-sulfoxide reductase heme-binding subunit MsrQ [Candidatus Palauibacterales bacterium]MDP2482562.1 protein-methionine-sulfoxide reductase heme-binding subunit MsrQ [Candidatus Palauibacterales bacterium]
MSAAGDRRRRAAIKTLIWAACLAPAVWLGAEALWGDLGANPIETITHRTGWWTLFLLTTTLAVTPARRIARRPNWVRYRRLLGLFAFFYGTLHFLTYLVLDQFFAWSFILEDIAERPFITVGFAAWLMLLALALTSTRASIRRLRKNWQRLHRLIYVAAVAGGIHFFWGVKADKREPLIFIVIITVLLSLRVWAPWRRRAARPRQVPLTE